MTPEKTLLKEILAFLVRAENCNRCSFNLDEDHHFKEWKALKARAKKILDVPEPN